MFVKTKMSINRIFLRIRIPVLSGRCKSSRVEQRISVGSVNTCNHTEFGGKNSRDRDRHGAFSGSVRFFLASLFTKTGGLSPSET